MKQHFACGPRDGYYDHPRGGNPDDRSNHTDIYTISDLATSDMTHIMRFDAAFGSRDGRHFHIVFGGIF